MLNYARFVAFMLSISSLAAVSVAQDPNGSLASQSVVHFTFAEENGPAKDSATAGQVPDEGKLINDPVRVASPFWNQNGKRAIQFDASKQQYIEVADGADVDGPTGVTVAMFLVNLTEPADAAYHGLFAKRGVADGKTSTNYGINFQMSTDNFQVYLHDGTDYRVATYGSKEAVPFRKLAYVTATYMAGDAPGQDADTDIDDVRMQYFINGEPMTPKSVGRGFVIGQEAWTLDVNLAGLLNSLPLNIGRSELAGEYTSCVIGDFRLFPRALSADEVKKLFLEVAGANVNELIAQDKAVPVKSPAISSLSQPGLQVGQTTQLIVNGTDLAPNSVALFPLPDVRFDLADGSTPARLVFNVTVPAETVPGLYPFWVKSHAGISKSVPLAIDRLPQIAMSSSPDKPATLPAVFYGTLSGGQQQVLYFQGAKNQRVVADVELKRLGGNSNPVIEIKSPSGAPLTIGWGQSSLKGDARAELVLPSDGLYSIELHDLTFNAPGSFPFRLKAGDLKLVDGLLPAAGVPGAVEVELVGTGLTAGNKFIGQFSLPNESRAGAVSLPWEAGIAGSLPSMAASRGIEHVEAARSSDGTLQSIDATFSNSSTSSVAISGRIASKGEQDRYLLKVTPGQKLKFTLQSDSLGSPLEGELRIFGYPAGNPLKMTGDQPSIGDPVLDFTVPAAVDANADKSSTQVQIQVRDLFGGGNPRSFYRLVIEKSDQPRFSIQLASPSVAIPEDGSAVIEVQVTRAGYTGPIQLSLTGDDAVKVSPNMIAAGQQGKTLLRLVRSGPLKPAALLRLVGESVGVEPAFKQTALLSPGTVAPTFTDTMAVGTTNPTGLSVELQQLPAVLFRGVSHDLGLVVKRSDGTTSATLPVKLSLDSTEPVRRRDPNNPAAGNFPVVSVNPRMTQPGEPEQTSVKIVVPMEVVDPVINFVIKAEATPHAYSDRVLATAYSQPFPAEIKNGVTPKLDDASLAFAGEVDHKLTGVLQRTAGFTGPVEATLVGLPAGHTVQAATIAADQDKLEIIVRGPKVAAETPVANVKLRVTSAGSLLVPESPVNLKIIP